MDLSTLAVLNQLKAFNCPLYEIGIKSQSSGKMMLREWDDKTIIKSIGWLKNKNLNGHDIFIRPFGTSPFIFIDDLSRSTFTTMKADGLNPAILIESSPFNFHGWIKLSDKPISEELATEAAKYLCKKYSGDPNSADWRHFGRLAGFTNRKPEHFNGVSFPFVKLHLKSGSIAEKGNKLLSLVRALQPKTARDSNYKPVNIDGIEPSAFYVEQLNYLIKRYGATMDESKADWAIANKMYVSGYSYEQIEAAIYKESPNLSERKKGHIRDYITRTLNKIFGDNQNA